MPSTVNAPAAKDADEAREHYLKLPDDPAKYGVEALAPAFWAVVETDGTFVRGGTWPGWPASPPASTRSSSPAT